MDSTTAFDDRNRLARILLAAVLSVVALRSFRKGKRLRGMLAGAGAVGVGYSVRSDRDGPVEVDIETTTEESKLRCAICGEPIVPGERRRPNENDETAHEACLEAST